MDSSRVKNGVNEVTEMNVCVFDLDDYAQVPTGSAGMYSLLDAFVRGRYSGEREDVTIDNCYRKVMSLMNGTCFLLNFCEMVASLADFRAMRIQHFISSFCAVALSTFQSHSSFDTLLKVKEEIMEAREGGAPLRLVVVRVRSEKMLPFPDCTKVVQWCEANDVPFLCASASLFVNVTEIFSIICAMRAALQDV